MVDKDFRGAIYWVLHNLINIAQERKQLGLRGGVPNDTSTGFGAVGEVVSLCQRLVSRQFRLGKQLAAGRGVWRQRTRAGRGGGRWSGRVGRQMRATWVQQVGKLMRPHGHNRVGRIDDRRGGSRPQQQQKIWGGGRLVMSYSDIE